MSTETSLQGIQDRQAIVDLTIAYAWIIDHGPRDRLTEIFTSDVVFTLRDIRGEGSERQFDGIDDVIAKIDGSLGRLSISQHLISNQQVELDGESATCGCYLQAQHTLRGTEGGDNYIMAGRYLDDVVRTDAGWRIARRLLIIDWLDGNPEVLR
jgi:3-phenylpropionate/cinnamic acid dioxygenase small subunit